MDASLNRTQFKSSAKNCLTFVPLRSKLGLMLASFKRLGCSIVIVVLITIVVIAEGKTLVKILYYYSLEPCQDVAGDCAVRAAKGDCWRTANVPSSQRLLYVGRTFPLWNTCPKSCRRCNGISTKAKIGLSQSTIIFFIVFFFHIIIFILHIYPSLCLPSPWYFMSILLCIFFFLLFFLFASLPFFYFYSLTSSFFLSFYGLPSMIFYTYFTSF